MRGKINEDGFLEIQRAGVMGLQVCPVHFPKGDEHFCGEWCPLFREPVTVPGGTTVRLCNGGEWFFTEFTDERL